MNSSSRRIGIDARFHGPTAPPTGLARYIQELISHASRIKSEHTFVVFLRQQDRPHFTIRARNIEVRATNIPHYTAREQLLFGWELKKANLDLMHFTNFNMPIGYRGPFVVTIHDLTLLRFAGRSKLSRLKHIPMQAVVRYGITHGRKVITISEYQRKLITKHFQIPSDRVEVIYEAVDPEYRSLPAGQINAFRKQKGLDKQFVMYAGQWREHKNLVRLIKAFKLVRATQDAKLVLAGKIDPAFTIIKETIVEQGLQDDVILTDYVKEKELPLYYNAAEVFAFPSLVEGFGLPPLEAMACGTAVASSNTGPMPEILGDAADYFNPRSTQSVADTIIKLLKNRTRREKFQKLGTQQVKKYSWSKTAVETLAAYDEALSVTSSLKR
ncbi:glycosyltransferase family 1 protein [Patescibacteria group bacterium]|nr:glycosyltransferase family 1 protein [Patescibacteria group bacterium]